MTLPSSPTNVVLTERWSTFYTSHGRGSYKYDPRVKMEEDRNRLRILRGDWLNVLREIPAGSSDWPTTKMERDQLMVLLRWDPSKMWKIARGPEIGAQDTTGNSANAYTTSSSDNHATQSDQDGRKRRPVEKGELDHTTRSLRPNVFPFAYIRSFYNESDGASMIPGELKVFAYEQSLKQIDNFYACAANYGKKLQEALQNCRNDLEASKLYDAFERDHQVLANRRNREWIAQVNDKMRELGITVPNDTEDDLDENEQPSNLELAAELSEGSTETRSIVAESSRNRKATQASSSSTMKRESVRPIGRSDDKMSHHQSESEVDTRARRPRGGSNEPEQPNSVTAHEVKRKLASRDVNQHLSHTEERHFRPEFTAHRGAGVPAPNPERTRPSGSALEDGWDNHVTGRPVTPHREAGTSAPNPNNLQSSRPAGSVPEDVWDNHITSHPIRKHDEHSEIWQNHSPKAELGLRNKAYYRSNHPGWKFYKDVESPLMREQSPVLDVPEDAWRQGNRIADNHFSGPGLMNNASHRNPPVNNPIPTSPPPGYDARPLPMEGMLGSASSNQSGPRRFHSNFGGAPLREETNYAGRSGPEPQPEARHRRAHRVPNFMPQDFQVREPPSTTGHGLHQPGTQVRDVRPGTSDDYVPDNHEALGTGHRRYDGVRNSYPTASLRRHTPSFSSSNEKPVRYVASPAKTHYESGTRPEPEQPSKSFSSRQQRPHGPAGVSSAPGQSSGSAPYPERISPTKPTGSQGPRLQHQKATNRHNAEGWPGDPAKVDGGHSRQFPSTSTEIEPDDTTQDINWQAFNGMLEQMIENLYAGDAEHRGKSFSQKMEHPNHIAAAADDLSAEDGDASLISSDESDLTDSDELEKETDEYGPMDNPSISSGVNMNRTVPFAEDSRRANVAMNGSSSRTQSEGKPSVSWGQVHVYSIDPEAVQQRNRATPQGMQPRSALKR